MTLYQPNVIKNSLLDLNSVPIDINFLNTLHHKLSFTLAQGGQIYMIGLKVQRQIFFDCLRARLMSTWPV